MPSMVMLVMHDSNLFGEMLAAWRAAGAPAVTILDSVGTRELDEQAKRDDLPLMPSIRDLLQADDAPRKTIFAVVQDDTVDPLVKATHDILGDLSEPKKGILVVMPVSQVYGFRKG